MDWHAIIEASLTKCVVCVGISIQKPVDEMRKLVVVSHVSYNPVTGGTRNPSVDTILREYSGHFDELVVVLPYASEVNGDNRLGQNIKVWTVISNPVGLMGKLNVLGNYLSIRRRMRYILECHRDAIVQLRIPSVFSMTAFSVVREFGMPLTTYIAGDWPSSLAANYKFPGNVACGRVLDFIQRRVIRKSVPVTAGPALAARYSDEGECHPYFSTTHRSVIRRTAPQEVHTILFVGRLEPRKRLGDAIDALLLLREGGIRMRLVVVGDGEERSRLEARVEKMGLAEYVEFKGYVRDRTALDMAFQEADVLVLPSVSEGTAKVLAEAMSRGVAPVAVDGVGSNNFIITAGVNGLLYPARDIEALATCLRRLHDDKELYQGILENGYKYAAAHTITDEVKAMWDFVRARL